MKRPPVAVAQLIAALLAHASTAHGQIVVPEPGPRPPEREHASGPLTIEGHHVDVKIDGQVATTELHQVFSNPTDRRLEATHIFPLPKGARINQFQMTIDGKPVEAELLGAKKARRIYERIVRQRNDPALLEYVGRGAFKVRIFPIEPHTKKPVTLKYTQFLQTRGGLVEYSYPLGSDKLSAAPIDSLSLRCRIKTNHALKSLYSPTHRVEIRRKGESRAVVGFEKSGFEPESDFRLIYSAPRAPEHGIAMNLLTHRGPGDEKGFFMLLASPGTDVTGDEVAAKDVVFVLDTSGSMRGRKLAQAKRALRYCVKHLRKRDRFEIVRFSTEAEALFDGAVTRADAEAREEALGFLNGLDAVGGTAIHAALTKAVAALKEPKRSGRPAIVVFLTDGRPTIGKMTEDAIVKAVDDAAGARVFPFGIGTDINTHLLDRISRRTGAFTQYVMPDEQIDEKLKRFYRRIAHPVLMDIALKASGDVRLTRTSPKKLGPLFRGQQLVQFGRYRGSGDAALTLTGRVGDKRVELVREQRFPERRKDHRFVARLWATRRVGYLLDQIRLHGAREELRNEVVRLARRYGVVTPYTSYLIMKDERRRGVQADSRTLGDPPHPPPADGAESASELENARETYQRFLSAETGSDAVGGARVTKRLRQARRESDSDAAASRPVSPSEKPAGTGASAGPNRATQFAGGRAFYRRGDQWIGATVPAHPDAERVRVELGSDRYFALLRKHPKAYDWFSVGRKLQVRIGDTIYVVR